MAEPAQQPEQDEGVPQNGQDAGQKISDGMMAVRTAIAGFGQMLSGKLPPEAMKQLEIAQKAYDNFLSIAMKSMGVENAPDSEDANEEAMEGNQADMASGSKNAVPADSMSGGNANAKAMY